MKIFSSHEDFVHRFFFASEYEDGWVIEFSIVLGLLFTIFCAVLIVTHSLSLGRLTLLDWALLAIGGMYGLGWILVLLVTQSGGNPVWEDWINPFSAIYPLHSAAAYLLVIGMLAGWSFPSKLIPLAVDQPAIMGLKHQETRWALAFWIMLVLAVMFQWLYAKNYGGYFGLMKYTSYIRSSQFANVPDNPWSFLKPFGGLAMISAYGFFGLWLSRRRGIGTVLGLILAFALSLYILYSWLGRMGFLVFLAIFALGVVLEKRSSPIKVLVLGAASFLILLFLVYNLSLLMNLKAAASLPRFLARELSYPFASFFAQFNDGEHLYRGFVDFLLSPVYLLPSSWWDNWFNPVGDVNTALIMGAPKGEGGVTGAIPVDLLTLGLMQSGLVGIIVVGALFGLFLRLLQKLLDKIPFNGVRGVFEAYLVLNIAVLGVFYAQPDLVISGNFALIFGGFIVLGCMTLPSISLAK